MFSKFLDMKAIITIPRNLHLVQEEMIPHLNNKVGLKDVEFSKDKWGVTNGNQRVYFARENGYIYIEAVEVKSQEERDIINKIIYINPYKYPT